MSYMIDEQDSLLYVLRQSIESATKWILRDLVPLDRYALGRVALAGDAVSPEAVQSTSY